MQSSWNPSFSGEEFNVNLGQKAKHKTLLKTKGKKSLGHGSSGTVPAY
jgi:hypothetical protein